MGHRESDLPFRGQQILSASRVPPGPIGVDDGDGDDFDDDEVDDDDDDDQWDPYGRFGLYLGGPRGHFGRPWGSFWGPSWSFFQQFWDMLGIRAAFWTAWVPLGGPCCTFGWVLDHFRKHF